MFEKPFRMHPSIIIEQVFQMFWATIFLVFTFGRSYNLLLVGSICFAVYFLIIWVYAMRWRKTFISITGDSLLIEKRLLFHKKTVIGIKNISNINMEQKLFQRLIGTCQIKLDTNSSSTADQTDVTLVLKKSVAIEFSNYINQFLTQEENVEISEDKSKEKSEENDFDFSYGFTEVLAHTILSVQTYQIAVLIAFLIGAFFFIQEDITEILHNDSIWGMILGFVLLVGSYVTRLFQSLFRLYGFQIARQNDKIKLQYGLLSKKDYLIPVDKIHAIKIKEPPLARFMGKCFVEIINVGMGNEKEESSTLLLLASKSEIEQRLSIILPEMKIDFARESQPKAALIPITIQAIVIAGIVSIIILAITKRPWIILVIVSVILLFILSGYYSKKIKLEEERVHLTSGIFGITTSVISYRYIEKMTLHYSLLTKKLGIAKAEISILASTTNRMHTTGYFPSAIFERIADKMLHGKAKRS
ncbi:MAG: PH domain-containing protein [Lachnotalea sp.]